MKKMRSNSNMINKAVMSGMAIAACVILAVMPKMDVEARELLATIQGTVCKGTTSDRLYLYNLSEGTYDIKIDNDTDTSRCKMLIPGKAVTVGIYRGDDANLHADSIVSGKIKETITLDNNNTTVKGKVMEASTDEMLYLDTSGGEMHIKIDSSSNLSGVRVMTVGKEVTAVVTRGSDATLHAVSISEENNNATTTNNSNTTTVNTSTTNTQSQAPANTIAVTGTPTEKSSSGILYLQTNDGVMYLVVDDSADTSGGFMFTTGNKLTAYVYRGDDANMHVAKLTGTRSSGATVGSSAMTFSGSVEGNSTDEILYLNTSGGIMKFKLDAGTTLSGAKGLQKGKIVTVSGAVGSDEYWHALSIAAK